MKAPVVNLNGLGISYKPSVVADEAKESMKTPKGISHGPLLDCFDFVKVN